MDYFSIQTPTKIIFTILKGRNKNKFSDTKNDKAKFEGKKTEKDEKKNSQEIKHLKNQSSP